MSIRRLVQRACTAMSFLLLPATVSLAQNPVSIDSVTVLPAGIITPVDPVSLDVFLVSGSAPIQLFSPTEVMIAGNEIRVDVFASSGLLTVLDARHEFVPLGTFMPGTYSYEVHQNGPTMDPGIVTGSFQVIPEPTALTLAAVGLLACGVIPRGRRAMRNNRAKLFLSAPSEPK